MNEAGFDVTPVEMDLSSRESIQALIAGGRSTARSRCWRMPALTAEQGEKLATTPTEELLSLDFLQP